jgi:dTDP-4-amino-4,6-dideoxygalactose transaminase
MEVPLYKVPPVDPELVVKTLESGWLGEGERVKEFEKSLKDYLGTDHLLATNSCTSALQLALHLVQDEFEVEVPEVITTPYTCIAVPSAIHHAGYKIVWGDIHPYTYNLNLDYLLQKLNEKTRAVVVPHFCGDPVDLNHLYNILRKHFNVTKKTVWVIEDCASAFGSEYKRDKIGAQHKDIMGEDHKTSIKCFSFQATKTLTTGDGGAIVLPNKQLYERAKLLRWYGLSREEERYSQNVNELGVKCHMNDIAASIGLSNMKDIKDRVEKQKSNRLIYYKELKRIGPIRQPHGISSCGQFPLRIKKKGFVEFMKEKGIEVRQPHGLLNKHLCMPYGDLANADQVCHEVFCVPSGWWMSEDDVYRVIEAVREFNE